jgi:hypothetical protein
LAQAALTKRQTVKIRGATGRRLGHRLSVQ